MLSHTRAQNTQCSFQPRGWKQSRAEHSTAQHSTAQQSRAQACAAAMSCTASSLYTSASQTAPILSSCSLPKQTSNFWLDAAQLVKGFTRAMLLKLRERRQSWLAVNVVRQSGSCTTKAPPAGFLLGLRAYYSLLQTLEARVMVRWTGGSAEMR